MIKPKPIDAVYCFNWIVCTKSLATNDAVKSTHNPQWKSRESELPQSTSQQNPILHHEAAMITITFIAGVIGTTGLILEFLNNNERPQNDRNHSKGTSLRPLDGATEGLQRAQSLQT